VLVDRNEDDPNAPEDLEECLFFGQLVYIITFLLPANDMLHLRVAHPVAFVTVRICVLQPDDRILPVNVDYYAQLGLLDILYLATVQCGIGCVPTRNIWLILDRTGTLHCAWYISDNEYSTPTLCTAMSLCRSRLIAQARALAAHVRAWCAHQHPRR
jgi:hypothetical protein